MPSSGYGFNAGPASDKTIFMPAGKTGAGVQFNNPGSTPYLYAFLSRVQLDLPEKFLMKIFRAY
jgi:hypothetical protein